MTDHRVTDLSYGHPGKASYDTEENQWSFSVNAEEEQHIRQILPFKKCLPPSIQKALKHEEQASIIAKSQLKWLLKSHPETYPGNGITSALAKAAPASGFSPESGTLMTIVKVVDSDRLSGHFLPPIAAIPHGEAGHVLHLMRLRPTKYTWKRHDTPTVSLLEPDHADQGYWMGTGGTIRQIAYSQEENGSSTWLAVRQSSVTTILRPCFGPIQPAQVPASSGKNYPPSRLSANPVANLTTEKSNSASHMDVSFNPWYSRQLAVVDTLGAWSIWDIEGNHSRQSSQKLVPGKTGNIHVGYIPNPLSRQLESNSIDGWHRILWVCDISTLVVANRRHVAVFNLKAAPTRLHSIDFSASSSSDWVLDIRRSISNPNHLFVLTTARIFWVDVVPAGDNTATQSGARILLSYRHFRDANDETMRLLTLEDDTKSVLISSGKTRLVNVYLFSIHPGTIGGPISQQSSFMRPPDQFEDSGLLHTLCFLPVSLTYASGEDPEDDETDARFFRMLALSSTLALYSALSVHIPGLKGSNSQGLWTTSPALKAGQKNKRVISERYVESRFIIPDGLDEDLVLSAGKPVNHDYNQELDDLHLRMDWKAIFKHVFPSVDLKELQSRPQSPAESSTMTGLLNGIYFFLQDAKDMNKLTMATILQLFEHASLHEELDRAATSLQEFLQSLKVEHDDDATSNIAISDLTSCPAIVLPTEEVTALPSLLGIYDELVDNWMADLPQKFSNQARLVKHRIIRQLAIDICLSSIGISLKTKSIEQAVVSEGRDLDDVDISDRIGRDSSPLLFSPEMTPSSFPEPSLSLPSPARTPSLYSHATTGSELGENPAISRLRQYAVSIDSQLDPGKSKLLSNWVPGGDPAEYSWEKAQKGDDREEENERRRRREEARRRRRTEKFLNRERARAPVAAAAESQPAFLPSGSQPDVAPQFGFSSQPVEELPMTQPNRGTFGSRTAQKGKKKGKKRAAGF